MPSRESRTHVLKFLARTLPEKCVNKTANYLPCVQFNGRTSNSGTRDKWVGKTEIVQISIPKRHRYATLAYKDSCAQ